MSDFTEAEAEERRNWVPPPDPEPGLNGKHSSEAPRPGGDGIHADAGKKPGGNTKPPNWEDPVDFLADDALGAPVLEQRHVPGVIWRFALDTAARMGVDPASVALSALVSCASVCSDDWAIQPKRHDYLWVENPRLWGAIVGAPSILKSPVIAACTKPVDKLEAQARREHSEKMKQWRAEEAAAKADKTAPPPKPRCDRFMVENATIDALSEVLRDDEEARFRAPCRKVLSRHDEMGEFFGGLDRYKQGGKGGSDRGAYLRLYNGGRHTIDRIGRGSFVVENWSACYLGGIQPEPIQRIARDADDDGLLQRFMYVVPDGQGDGVDQTPDYSAAMAYEALFPALVAMRPAVDGESERPRPVVFHDGAHRHRESVDALAKAMTAMPDASPRLKAALGKWRGLFARLCLVFHLVEIADQRVRGDMAGFSQVVPERIAEQVAAYMREIVLPHLLRAEQIMFSTAQSGHARWIAGFILAKGAQTVSVREIVMSYRQLRSPEARRELTDTMHNLVNVGWLDPEEPENPLRPVSSWKVNPLVHAKFAERAKAEAERRQQEKARIAEAVARARRDGRAC